MTEIDRGTRTHLHIQSVRYPVADLAENVVVGWRQATTDFEAPGLEG